MGNTAQTKSSSKFLKQLFYRNLPSPRTRYRDAVAHLGIPRHGRILDIGCGYTAPDLQDFNLPPVLKVGIDMVDWFDKKSAKVVRFCSANASALPFDDNVFNAVVCRSVVEHLDDPPRTFQEVSRVLVPNGHFVFLTPNRYDYVSIIASAIPNRFHGKIVRITTGREEKDTFPTRYRSNTIGTLRKLARSIGFEATSLELIREHPHYLQFNPLVYLVGVVYEQTVERLCKPVRPWILGIFRKPG